MDTLVTSDPPLVTILIATRDRPDNLKLTLQQIRRQNYPRLEVIVIDDGSTADLKPLVRSSWPEAVFVRHETSTGQCRRRSEGFAMARGEFLLQLDDDSHPVAADAVNQAVGVMQANPSWGCLSFYVFNGQELPSRLPELQPKYHASFVGCGAFFRARALRQVGGYRDFFGNEWEEEELGLRLLAADWVIYFYPEILIHHHVSPRNRNQERTWTRQIRNKLWAVTMHAPLVNIPVEAGWVLIVGAIDAVRLFRFKAYAQALLQFSAGLPNALRLRQPMSTLSWRRYDVMRFRSINNEGDYREPAKPGFGDLSRWFTNSWMKRARQRSVWDKRPGDTGRSPTVGFAHEYTTSSPDRDG